LYRKNQIIEWFLGQRWDYVSLWSIIKNSGYRWNYLSKRKIA
jgi:hypothetical protein